MPSIAAYNALGDEFEELGATVYATVTTDSRDELAQSLASQLDVQDAKVGPLLARLADWVHSLGVDELATVSTEVAEHRGPLQRLDERAGHQMSESEEGLYAELSTTGSGAWGRLMQDVTSQLTTEVDVPRRPDRDAADAGGPRARDVDRRRRPTSRVRRRDAGVADGHHTRSPPR